MVSSVTTLGYLVMTILYHWPWEDGEVRLRSNIHHGKFNDS